MFRLKHYVALSAVVTAAAAVYAVQTRKHFFNAAIYMTTNKINVVVLVNLCFLLVLVFGLSLKSLFLGVLTRDESEELLQQCKFSITETMLALTIFREEVDLRVVSLFTALLFVKCFHWIGGMRVESLARAQVMSVGRHVRLVGLMGVLAIVDWTFVGVITISILQKRKASVLLLFGFEYLILSVQLASTFFKYLLLLYDTRQESRGQHWTSKNAWMFYLEFTADLVRLFLYLIFFLLICTFYGLPLHLIRELGVTFFQLRERLGRFIQFKRLTRNMNERFPDATEEELAAADKTCIVCREDMEVGATKKLPTCGHMFHFACLRTWLERSQSCPTCRSDIPVEEPPRQRGQPHAQAGQRPQLQGQDAQGADAAVAVPRAENALADVLRPPEAPVMDGPRTGTAAGITPAPSITITSAGASTASSSTTASASVSLQLPPLPPGMPPLPPHLQMHLDALRMAAAQAHQELNASGAGNVAAGVTGAAPSASLFPPQSPLHPLFGSTPTPMPPLFSPHQFPQFPSATSPPNYHTPSFSFNRLPTLAAPNGAGLFPPPPPPPPATLLQQPSIPTLHPSPSSSASTSQSTSSSSSAFPSLPTLPFPSSLYPAFLVSPTLYLSYLSHHSMLLSHHADFLNSSLKQVQILQQQHREIEEKVREYVDKQQNEKDSETETEGKRKGWSGEGGGPTTNESSRAR